MVHPLLSSRQAQALCDRRNRLLESAKGRVLQLEVGMSGQEVPTGSFDTVIACLVLCSSPDPAGTLAEVHRWLAPTGQLLILEHVAGVGFRAALQRASSRWWSAATHGCHPERDTVNIVRQAGFAVTDLERFGLPGHNPLLTPCVQAIARPRPLAAVDAVSEKEEATR